VPPTVLIASPEFLPALQERKELGETVAFADTDALKALDLITRQRPKVVALERDFAATSRGTALINRIKADPSLTGCEIRIITHDNGNGTHTPTVAVAEAPAAPTVAAAPLDQTGTRRAPRFNMADGFEVQVDNKPATLVNLSLVGAQVVSPTILKPNQRVRFVLADKPKPIRIGSVIAWASFELPKGGPRYRAGVEFFDADQALIQKVIDANRKK
jgi:CheY-like chemotaxis protein